MYASFLGLGQGGSNVADEAAKEGFYTGAINFSQRDLDSLENIELKLKLVGSEGIGKQRSNAVKLMNNNWDLATNFVKENFSHSSIELIFVPFATGGGSGSGIAPVILSLLSEAMPEKVFVAMPILPDIKESYQNQRNTLETFEDLSQLDICILPIDNDKAKSMMINSGKNNLYKKINQDVVGLIKTIVDYTDRHSKYGVLDKKDLRSIFAIKGMATISEVSLTPSINHHEISDNAIANKIKESWIKSCFADVELNQVIGSGFIYDGQEKLMDFINLEKVYSSFNNKYPLNLYEGYYTEGKDKVYTVLSGMTWPNSRLKQIDGLLESTNDVFNNLDQETFYKSKSIRQTMPNAIRSQTKPEKISDISSIINKFKR